MVMFEEAVGVGRWGRETRARAKYVDANEIRHAIPLVCVRVVLVTE